MAAPLLLFSWSLSCRHLPTKPSCKPRASTSFASALLKLSFSGVETVLPEFSDRALNTSSRTEKNLVVSF